MEVGERIGCKSAVECMPNGVQNQVKCDAATGRDRVEDRIRKKGRGAGQGKIMERKPKYGLFGSDCLSNGLWPDSRRTQHEQLCIITPLFSRNSGRM